MTTEKTDFQKVSDYLLVLSIGVGLYPMKIIGEFMRDSNFSDEDDQPLDMGVPDDIKTIYQSWTEKEEAAFLIYFGDVCMRELEAI